jgi:hypothetical protein
MARYAAEERSRSMAYVIVAYKRRIYQAYSAWEQGTSYQLEPWGSDTEYYKAEEDYCYVGIDDALRIGYTRLGELMLFDDSGYGITLQDAVESRRAKEITNAARIAALPDDLPCYDEDVYGLGAFEGEAE